jgi:hypothetical protein
VDEVERTLVPNVLGLTQAMMPLPATGIHETRVRVNRSCESCWTPGGPSRKVGGMSVRV